MALHIGLIHNIETIVVEHCIHLGRTWIVAGAHQVHIGLLHELDILEHCGNVHCTSIKRMGILCVHTLEVYTLTVDEHNSVLDFDMTETVLGREHHLLISGSILLAHNYSVEVWSLRTPCLQR